MKTTNTLTKEDIEFYKTKNFKKKPDTPPAFGSVFTNYMFEMTYTAGIGWHDPVIKPFSNIEISPAALCLHYGQTIFEGLKAIKRNDKTVLFRADANYKRMNNSANRMCMPNIDVDFCIEATKMLISKEEDAWFYDHPTSSVYIRPFMFATHPSVNVIESPEYKFFIILSPMTAYFSDNKVQLITETNYMRVPANGTGEIKNGGNYGGAFIASSQAAKKGFSQVLWLDSKEQKYVEEAGMMNVFFIKDNKLITPPTQGSILKGITRDSVIKIAPDLGYEVEECNIDINDIVKWHKEGIITEAFASGTAASIQPLDLLVHDGIEMRFSYDDNSACNRIFNHLEAIKDGSITDKYNFTIRF